MLNKLNIFSYSFIVGIVTSLAGLSIAYTLVSFGRFTGLYDYSEEDLDVYKVGWDTIVLTAPLIESVIVLVLIKFSEMFTSKENSVTLVTVFFSLLHGFSSWISVFAVLPLFFISIKSYFLFSQKTNSMFKGFIVIYLIHLVNNSVIIAIELY